MNDQDGATRICGRQGCGKKLRASNRTGFCAAHYYDAWKAKNGGATPAAKKSPAASKPTRPAPTKAAHAEGVTTLCVTESHLNAYLLRLPLERKTVLVQRDLEEQINA